MKNILKKVWNYLMAKTHITMIPDSANKKVKTFSFRKIYLVIALLLIITTISSLGFLYKFYEENYKIAKSELKEMKKVKTENQQLKNELITLNKETEQLRQDLLVLENHNTIIKNLINDSSEEKIINIVEKNNSKLQPVISYNNNLLNQGNPIGGGNFELSYEEPADLIENMHKNINFIKKEIPEEKDELKSLEAEVKEHNAEVAATPKIWPLADDDEGYISSNFGWREDPVSSEREYHEGLDIAVWYNTPVLATAYGEVSYVGWSAGYGRTVRIEHGYGYETIYGHLNKIGVEVGEEVKRGEEIALSGNSGRSTGPHLHYEVRVDGVPKNPEDFIGG
ncbi:MAG: peptidoglycan DD-metalloendopeptidase family protein [Bacillota bacterium]